jgi:hypothetical protein
VGGEWSEQKGVENERERTRDEERLRQVVFRVKPRPSKQSICQTVRHLWMIGVGFKQLCE